MRVGRAAPPVKINRVALDAYDQRNRSVKRDDFDPKKFTCVHEERNQEHVPTPWGRKLLCSHCHIKMLHYEFYVLDAPSDHEGGNTAPRIGKPSAVRKPPQPRKSVGASLGLGVLATWTHAFEEHNGVWGKSEVVAFMRSEFPAGGDYEALFNGAVRRYNRGEFTGGKVPQKLFAPKV